MPASTELRSPADALRRLILALARPAEREHTRRVILEEAGLLFGARGAAICLPAPETAALRVVAGTGVLASREGELLPLEGSLEGIAFEAGAPRLSANLRDDPRAFRAGERTLPDGPALALPLRWDEHSLALLLVLRPAGAPAFVEAEVAQGERFAEAAVAALQCGAAYAEARRSEAEIATWRAHRDAVAWKERHERLAWCERRVVMEIDPAAERIVWGATCETVFGYPAPFFGSSPEAWLQRLHADDRAGVLAAIQTAAREGAETRAPCRVAHAFGGYRDAVLHCCAGEVGAPVVGVLAEQISGAAETVALDGRHEAVRDLVRALRHEINNPLAVVIGEAQLLRDEALGSLDPALRHSVLAIVEQSTRINDLVRRLSTLEDMPRDSYMNEHGGIDFADEEG
ncbi:MAG: PAS domain-containing protein [Gemmatimonadota bacterium]|nr:PAS domain-containing protein [Gemmatimonadota bacterium]